MSSETLSKQNLGPFNTNGVCIGQVVISYDALVSGFTSVDSMFEALEKNEIDGILMDKYKVGYYLKKRDNERFKMFDAFDANIPYYVAIRDSDPIKEMLNEGACFERRIEGNAVNELLISHLQPVTVSNTQRKVVTLFSDTPRYRGSYRGDLWHGSRTEKNRGSQITDIKKFVFLSHTEISKQDSLLDNLLLHLNECLTKAN